MPQMYCSLLGLLYSNFVPYCFLFIEYYAGDEIEKNYMDGSCDTYGGE